MAYTTAELDEKIEKTKAMITAYEDAIVALSTDGQTYSLDTGQTRISVTRAQLGSLRSTLEHLEERLSTLCARRNGAGLVGRPGF